jgi:hypothetical protein
LGGGGRAVEKEEEEASRCLNQEAVEVPKPEGSWEQKEEEEEEEACLAEYLRNKTALMEAIRNKGSDSLRQRRTVSVSACSSSSSKEAIRNKGSDCFG